MSKPGAGSSGSSAGSGVNLSEQRFRGSGEGGLPPKIWTLRSETVIELYELYMNNAEHVDLCQKMDLTIKNWLFHHQTW